MRWTVLPQGLTESPNLFGQALEQILQEYQPAPEITLIQYVDDLLIAGKEEEKGLKRKRVNPCWCESNPCTVPPRAVLGVRERAGTETAVICEGGSENSLCRGLGNPKSQC